MTNHGEGGKQSLRMSKLHFLASSGSARALCAVMERASSTGAHPASAQCLFVVDDDSDGGAYHHL